MQWCPFHKSSPSLSGRANCGKSQEVTSLMESKTCDEDKPGESRKYRLSWEGRRVLKWMREELWDHGDCSDGQCPGIAMQCLKPLRGQVLALSVLRVARCSAKITTLRVKTPGLWFCKAFNILKSVFKLVM